MNRIVLFIIVFIFLVGCASKKKLAYWHTTSYRLGSTDLFMAHPSSWVKEKNNLFMINEFMAKDGKIDSSTFNIIDKGGRWDKKNFSGKVTYSTSPEKKPQLIRKMIFDLHEGKGSLLVFEDTVRVFEFKLIHSSLSN